MASYSTCPPVKQSVLLGLKDASIGIHEACSWDTNKIGGLPDCARPLTMRYPNCSVCSSSLIHVVQVYCPLEGSLFHRVLNVFACISKSCWGNSESWKVLRSQYLEARVEEKQDCSVLQEVLSARDWCEEADDWGMDDTVEPQRDAHPDQLKPNALTVSPSTKEPDCTVQMQSLSLADRGQGLVIPNSPPVFQSHHISVVDEEDYAGYVDVDHAQKLLNDYQQREGVDVEELISAGFAAKGEQEKYEKSATKSRDRVFHQFMKRISLCHEQILRYSWKGQPLFITSPPSSLPDLVPKCGACGSGRVFEFQLMPALVSMLASVDKGVSVEFGTALVYTCEKSCWSSDQSSPVEEFIFIQEDPDQSFFR